MGVRVVEGGRGLEEARVGGRGGWVWRGHLLVCSVDSSLRGEGDLITNQAINL